MGHLDAGGIDASGRPDLVERGRRLFQFLAAAQRLRLKPARTTESYERDGIVLWLGDMPSHPALSSALDESAPDPEAPLLTVQRVVPHDPPAPDPILEDWLDGPLADPEHPAGLRTTRMKVVDGVPVEGALVLKDHPDVEPAFRRWRSAWDAWATQEMTDRPVRAVYRQLFAAYTTALNQPEEFELVLGVGCLAWAPENHERVRRHTLVTPVALDLDPSTGTLTASPEPALDSLSVELDMLDPAHAPASGIRQDVVERARVHDAHPLDRVATGDLLRRLVNGLDADGRYDDADARPQIGASAVMAFAPAIILRHRSQTGLVAVFDQIEAAIASTGAVPDGLVPLLDPDHVPSVTSDSSPGAMVDIDQEVFLPMPLNDRQLDIIQRVDRQAQTLVQGPPGTGKTHLAAALISHLLAQGKRVLVTAHTDRALKEVRAKLPEHIRPLAVSVVGADRSDLADLKVAVEHISARSQDSDPESRAATSQAAIEASLAAIDQLRRRRAEMRERLVSARAEDVAQRSFAGYEGTLAGIAAAYREQVDQFAWLLDHVQVRADDACTMTGAEASRWLELLRDEDVTEESPESSGSLIDLDLVATPEQFATLIDRYQGASAEYTKLADASRHPLFPPLCALTNEDRQSLSHRMTELARRVGAFEQRREPWMRAALQDIRTGRMGTWVGRAEHIDRLLRSVWPGVQQLGPAVRVTIAEGVDRASIGALAAHLRRHVEGGSTIKLHPDGSVKLGTFTDRAVKDSRPLFDAVRVDGRPPTTADQLATVVVFLDVEQHLAALDQAWPADVQIPAEDTVQERFQWHATEVRQLQDLLVVGQEIAQEQQRFEQLRLPQPDWSDLDAVLAVTQLVEAASAYQMATSAAHPIQELQQLADTAAGRPDAAPACARLAESIREWDKGAYMAAHRQLAWAHGIRRMRAERDSLSARVVAMAPTLAATVAADPTNTVWDARLSTVGAAWDWVRVGAWILGQSTEDANVLQLQLDVAEDAIRAEIERLAGNRAWQHALSSDRLTGQSRADLNLYVRLVKRLGKGTGKYAAARRAEIRQAMDRCRPAVPVWIMPIYRIAEQLRVSENMFDVVIVDEASQAGLDATFLQYLAPKIVVIGDDKQVSPSAVGVDQQQLRDLATQYLRDYRYKETWQDPKMSLFDAASIWYGNKRTLVEHRRCVPEIIEFSNRIAYEPENIRLIPVRQFGADRLEPVRPVHVPDGYETGGSGTKVNRPEADAVVAQVEKCLADRRYDGKTFGVISLLGPRQAKLINDVLLERVPPEEWVARDLRCGDAAAFQGSERDVVFLSMVSAPEPGQRMGALTVEANVQRYNVAASRAKDQMWLFHSVQLDQLTNPEDMRFRLLDYCYHGVAGLRLDDSGAVAGVAPHDRLVEPFDSLFEQRVHNRLVERGYTVVPQFDSMGYRIDLVVIGARGRLAVECDGDYWHGPDQYLKDLARERDLRRCGWKFFRVKESSFYVDEHAALSPLWASLDALGIRPAGWTAAEHVENFHPAEPIKHVEPIKYVEPRGHVTQIDAAEEVAQAPAIMAAPRIETAVEPSPPKPLVHDIPVAPVQPTAPQPPAAARVVVEVPEGYRLVGWIRPHEAFSAIQAHELQSDVPVRDDAERVVGWARYHADDSPEAIKYRSNVELQRASARHGARIVAWLKPAEAEAIVRSATEQRDVHVAADGHHGETFVQYFAPGSAEAVTYRSVTRLLRRSR